MDSATVKAAIELRDRIRPRAVALEILLIGRPEGFVLYENQLDLAEEKLQAAINEAYQHGYHAAQDKPEESFIAAESRQMP